MKRIFTLQAVPWWMAAMFALAFVIALLTHGLSRMDNKIDGVVQDGSGKRVLYWADPMFAQGPPHTTIAKEPGIAADCKMKLIPIYANPSTPTSTTARTTARTTAPSGYGNVSLTPERQQLIGVKLGKAELRNLSRTVRTTGVVTADERRLARVQSKFEGFAETLNVNVTGETVRRGQSLLSIYSPDLLATQNELLLAAKNPSEIGKTLFDAARRRLMLWDMSATDIDAIVRNGRPQRSVTLRSPVDGVVMNKNVVAGARIMPGDTLYELADLRTVWVLADVHEADVPYVRTGTSAHVSLAGRNWNGSISFIAPAIDPVTRTAKVRIELSNVDGVLKPQTYVDVVLQIPVGNGVAVPESAVLQTGTRSIVFVSTGTGHFEPRQVTTGAHVDGFFEIRSGVATGDTVVIDANFLVDSESRLKSALGQMAAPAQKAAQP